MMHDDSRENVADWDGRPMTEHRRHHDAGVREIVEEAERRGAEKALREAANALNVEAVGFRPGWGSGNEGDMGALDVLGQTLQWLRERADRIGGGE